MAKFQPKYDESLAKFQPNIRKVWPNLSQILGKFGQIIENSAGDIGNLTKIFRICQSCQIFQISENLVKFDKGGFPDASGLCSILIAEL